MTATTRTVAYAATDDELFREQMRSSAQGDGASPRTFAYLLQKAEQNRVWERLTGPQSRPFGSFRAFLEAPEATGGLGMNEERLYHAASLAGVLDLAQRLYLGETVTEIPHGGDRRSPTFQVRDTQLKRETTADDAERVVARLKRDDPELAEKVVRGEVTPNAAAREKGWRKPRIILSSPERIAASLRRYMPREAILRLAELLTKEEDP